MIDVTVIIDDSHITHREGMQMNWDQIEGNWKQLKGNVKAQWGKLTDDELDVIAGKRDQLAGKIQALYGIAKDDVEKQISDWESTQSHVDCCAKEIKSEVR